MNWPSKTTPINLIPLNKVSWQKQVNQGYFLKGAIKAAIGAACVRCGHLEFKSVQDDFINYNVPKCAKCGGPPGKLRVTKYLPNGKVDLYRSLDGSPLVKISDALALIGKINEELKDGSYRPEKHDPKSIKRLKFNNYAEEYLAICERRTLLPDDHDDFIAPSTFRDKCRLIRNELKPFLKELPIDRIEKQTFMDISRSYISKFRTRDLALGELRTMIRYAFNELGIIEKVPAFPKIAKARKRKVAEVPSKEMQILIINEISRPVARLAWIIGAVLIKRPCEFRVYKVKDIDLKNKLVHTRSHLSKGLKGDVVLRGRKSIVHSDELGELTDKIDDSLVEMLKPLLAGKGPDDYVFTVRDGKPISYNAIWEAWNDACKRLGVDYAPYAGTKSASLTEHIKKGGTMEQAQAMAAHKNSKQTESYALVAAIDTECMIDSSVFVRGLSGVTAKRHTLKLVEINN